MAGGFDFKEVEKLKKQIEAAERGRDVFFRQCANELAARFLRMAMKRTPVGRAPKLDGPTSLKVKGGSGKSRSFLTKNGAILKQYWAGYQGGTLRRSWAIGDIRKNGSAYEVEVINPTEYASYVEYGHRQKPGRYIPALGKRAKRAWVPGMFMMTITEQEVRRISPRLIEKRLEAFLRGCMDV